VPMQGSAITYAINLSLSPRLLALTGLKPVILTNHQLTRATSS
jgi:hypothetical protein